jgi:predicted dehydrogenase
MDNNTFGIGIIGGGNFGLFALQQLAQIRGIRLVAMAGTHREAALAISRRFGIRHLDTVEELLKYPGVDIVYISTPPFLHYAQSMMALNAGKHVICEKPMALRPEEAREMISLADKLNLLMVTNLMQRYNPLYENVKTIIEKKPLGELLHGYFENYAVDEGLNPEHWFWDKNKSGGIFIEHGVHFFDLFEGWIGKGKMMAAQHSIRPGTSFEEQVQCTVRYKDSIHVNYYHGFHQPSRLERQELRLVFERGIITLFEWIPTQIKIIALVDESETKILMDIHPKANLKVTSNYAAKDRLCMGRHKSLDVYQMVEISYGHEQLKMHLYCDLLKDFYMDQLAWIKDRNHQRKVTAENGYSSLFMAVEANRALPAEF